MCRDRCKGSTPVVPMGCPTGRCSGRRPGTSSRAKVISCRDGAGCAGTPLATMVRLTVPSGRPSQLNDMTLARRGLRVEDALQEKVLKAAPSVQDAVDLDLLADDPIHDSPGPFDHFPPRAVADGSQLWRRTATLRRR